MEADDPASFATADGIAVGTVDYMSPEQACGREVDGRSDLFSLGCSMYHLMTGKLPFPGDSPIERMGKRISGKHVPLSEVAPHIPAPLVRIIDQLLANKPHERFEDAGKAAEALQALVRPKSKPNSSTSIPTKSGTGTDAQPATVTIKEQVIVQIEPEYPGWFRPLASLAETKPLALLVGLLITVILIFSLGVAVGTKLP